MHGAQADLRAKGREQEEIKTKREDRRRVVKTVNLTKNVITFTTKYFLYYKIKPILKIIRLGVLK